MGSRPSTAFLNAHEFAQSGPEVISLGLLEVLQHTGIGLWRAFFLGKSGRLSNDADFSRFSPMLSTETVDNFSAIAPEISAIAARQRNRYDGDKPPAPNF